MTYKLQNLLNECIMLEESGYRLGKFSIDLLEAQQELDEIKQLLIQRVMFNEVEVCGRCNGFGKVLSDNGGKIVDCRYCT